MKAMVIRSVSDLGKNPEPLELTSVADPVPGDAEVLIKISACGVCHTEIDEIEGRTPPSVFPMIPGHQVIGYVEETGRKVRKLKKGDRVGVAWIFSACGKCSYCRDGLENLCSDFRATGRDAYGGYAEFMTVQEDFTYNIPETFSDSQAAPLLCAGAVGYRSVMLTGMKNGQKIGLTGFGASGHIVLKIIKYRYPRSEVFVFARNQNERTFAMELGAAWAGEAGEDSPVNLDSVIDTTPVWHPVVEAMRNLKPGGRLVINAIRKQDPDKDYHMRLDYPIHLWMETEIKSVANVTRNDVNQFLRIASELPIIPEVQEYSLGEANKALSELKNRKIRGAKVLVLT